MTLKNQKQLNLKIQKLVQWNNCLHNAKSMKLQAKVSKWIDQNMDRLYVEHNNRQSCVENDNKPIKRFSTQNFAKIAQNNISMLGNFDKLQFINDTRNTMRRLCSKTMDDKRKRNLSKIKSLMNSKDLNFPEKNMIVDDRIEKRFRVSFKCWCCCYINWSLKDSFCPLYYNLL